MILRASTCPDSAAYLQRGRAYVARLNLFFLRRKRMPMYGLPEEDAGYEIWVQNVACATIKFHFVDKQQKILIYYTISCLNAFL